MIYGWTKAQWKLPIEETLKTDEKLSSEVIEGKNLKQSNLYQRFFSNVRGNKEHDDNLGARIILFSTPKLVQYMFREDVEISVDEKISMTSRELVRKIMEPNGIKIVF